VKIARTTRERATLLAAAAVTAILISAGGSVDASNFGPQGNCGDGYCCVCYANNKTHKVFYSLSTQFKRAMNYVRTNIYNPTDVNTVGSSHANSDVAAFTMNYQYSGWYGVVDCIDYKNKKVCDHWHLHTNTFYGPNSRKEARAISCHEFGHTLGLQHTSASGTCMKSAAPSALPLRLRKHDRQHLNKRY
jgi:hypothetical protein